MEKNCKRREGINQTGCMWVFINIFGSNQKHLLMENKFGSKRFGGNNNEKKIKKKLICSCESSSHESIDTLIDEDVNVSVSASVEHVFDVSEVCKNSTNETEEKFRETIKRLIAQKEGEIKTCKDLLEAFHVLDSQEEESSLLKKKMISQEVDDGDSKRVEGEEKVQVVSQKKCSFFRRKWRRNRSRVSKTIVVVDDHSPINKSKIGRCFLIGLIKRRLKSSSVQKKSQNCCVQVEKQSKSKEHVSDEEELLCNQTKSDDSKRIMSGLYIAAKKHLSEMLANGDIDVNLPDKEVSRILGKILSLPEFSSPVDSPRLNSTSHLASHLSPLRHLTEKPMILQCGSSTSDLINEDTDKYDETLFTIDVSLPKGDCSSSVSRQVDEIVLECREEDRDNQSFKEETFNQAHTSTPECKEADTDVQGKLSPVSVLEPLFTDDENSPTTSTRRFSSAEMRIQPLCIRFDEADSPKPDKDNNVKTGMDDKELTLAYIEAVVKSSGLSIEELLRRSFYSEQLLEMELMDEVVFCSTQLCDDKNLLNDCINEVLMDFCGNSLNPGPRISFVKPEVHLIADSEIAAKVAQEGVYWHLLPLPSPHTLDQIISKDMARTGSWMDLRFDIGCIGTDTCEMILDELVEEVIRSCRDMVQDRSSDNIR